MTIMARASDTLSIPLGAIAEFCDERHGGTRYVFVGWAHTSNGPEAVMIREMQPGERLSPSSPWVYHCSSAETLLRRFPSLAQYAE